MAATGPVFETASAAPSSGSGRGGNAGTMMTRPRRFLLRMAIFLAAVAAVVALLSPGLTGAFMANPALNGLILGVLLVGIVMNVRQVMLLRHEVQWIEAARNGQPALSQDRPPRLVAPLAAMLSDRRVERFGLSAAGLRSVLDAIASRLEESREIAHYITGLLVFLGLLGTVWGLSLTVASIGNVIGNLSIVGDDIGTAFEAFKGGLAQPISEMGVAFSATLFGIGSSVVVGFLDLQAGQAQNAFYTELEDWLSSQTRIAAGATTVEGAGEHPVPAYIQALLEQTAESLDSLQRIIARGEEGRASTASNLRTLTDKLTALTDQMRAEQTLLIRLAESQIEIKPLLARLAEASDGGMDEATRGHVRNIDVALSRLVEEASIGRDEVIREMRSEFKLLARTIAALAEETEH